MNKKMIFSIGMVLYLVTAFFSYAYFSSGQSGSLTSPLGQPKTAGSASTLDLSSDDPKTEECPLNGQKYSKSYRKIWEGRRPMGVMIENHLEARPQSGLANADVIFEVVAEGGITRFLSIFYCQDAKLIGPVRSARIYFLELLRGFGNFPLYAHVGGANTPGPADALGQIRTLEWDGYNDLNQFAIPFPYYWRDYERLPGVATEHTMYSTTQKLWEFAAAKRGLTQKDKDGDSWDDAFNPWKFEDGKTSGSTSKISFDFWKGRPDYSVVWNYDAPTNQYKRSHGNGKPHTDKNSGAQLAASNLIVTFMTESSARDGYPGGHLLYKTVGSGKLLLFKNDAVVTGTWSRKNLTSLLRFFDNSGQEITLNRGPIWVEVVPEGNTVKY